MNNIFYDKITKSAVGIPIYEQTLSRRKVNTTILFRVKMWNKLLIIVLLIEIECYNISINEINASNPEALETNEFIELKLSTNQSENVFDLYGQGPSLEYHYLVMIKPAENADLQPRVVMYSNLSGNTFINSTYFVIGESHDNSDLLIEPPNVITKLNIYDGARGMNNIENGNNFPIAVLLIKTTNDILVKDLFEMRISRATPILANQTLPWLASIIVDMVIYGHKAPYNQCIFFDRLFTIWCAECKGSPIIYREYDSSNHIDYSINKCDSLNSHTNMSVMKLGKPSPGCPNDCTGVDFIIENFLKRLVPSMTPQIYSTHAPCTSNFSRESYYLSHRKLIELRDQIMGVTKVAGKRKSDERPQNEQFIDKRQCTSDSISSGITGMPPDDYGVTNENPDQIVVNTTPNTVSPTSTQCFMKNAARNDNPGLCGENGAEAQLHDLADLKNIAFDDTNIFTAGVENEAELILARGSGIFSTLKVNLMETFVCGKHLQLLGRNQNFEKLKRRKSGKAYLICDFPILPGVNLHTNPIMASRLFTSKDQAEALFELKDKLVPIGLRK